MRPTNIAIFHHHFNRGGVSRVVFSQLSALAKAIKSGQIKVAIFHGGREEIDPQLLQLIEQWDLDLVAIPALSMTHSGPIFRQMTNWLKSSIEN